MADRTRGARFGGTIRSQHDRCGRRQLLAPERSARRHDDVDACGLDALEHLDGAGDFAFERANAGDFLHEGGETERADLVEQLVAAAAAVRQTLFGQQRPRLGGLARANVDGIARGIDVEGYAGVAQNHAHARDVFAVKTGIEDVEFRSAQVIGAAADTEEDHKSNKREDRETPWAEIDQIVPKPLRMFAINHQTLYLPANRFSTAKLVRGLRSSNEGGGRDPEVAAAQVTK